MRGRGWCQRLTHRPPGARRNQATGSATRTGDSTDSESSGESGGGGGPSVQRGRFEGRATPGGLGRWRGLTEDAENREPMSRGIS